jgi:hypothetical protein
MVCANILKQKQNNHESKQLEYSLMISEMPLFPPW